MTAPSPAIRPIIFSGAMVRALLAGRKSQTRRLATSPLADCQPGDLLWVRESVLRGGPHSRVLGYAADGALPVEPGQRLVPSIHMPRPASRLTLEITGRRQERLQAISESDAVAEGMIRRTDGTWCTEALTAAVPGEPRRWTAVGDAPTARDCYRRMWQSLHGAEAWDDDPEVVVLVFQVHRRPIDAMPRPESGADPQ